MSAQVSQHVQNLLLATSSGAPGQLNSLAHISSLCQNTLPSKLLPGISDVKSPGNTRGFLLYLNENREQWCQSCGVGDSQQGSTSQGGQHSLSTVVSGDTDPATYLSKHIHREGVLYLFIFKNLFASFCS